MLEIDAFLQARSSGARPYSPKTRTQYAYNLRRISAWLDAEKIDPSTLTPAEFRKFLAPDWGPSHCHLMLATLKAYLRWKYGETHPLAKMSLARPEQPVPRTLSREDIDACFSVLSPTRRSDRRTAAMLSLCIDTGLRSAEVCNLRLDEIDLAKMHGQTRIKGGSLGAFIFSEATRDRILRWLPDRDSLAPHSPLLFVSEDGKSISREAFRWITWRLSKRAGIKRFSPHALRRAMACRLVENGVSERMTAALGRWKNTSMVYTYTRALNLEAAREFLPMAARDA